MDPFTLGLLGLGAAAAALATALWYLLRRQSEKQQQPSQEPNAHRRTDPQQEGRPGAKSGGTRAAPQPVVRRRTAAAIDEIVGRLTFASGFAKMKDVKVGETLVPSHIPSDEIHIRPIRDVSEIAQVPIDSLVLDDDRFFVDLAAQSLPVLEYQKRVDVTEEVAEVPRKVLVLVIDRSGSMGEHGRAEWAQGFCDAAIRKAVREKAEVALLAFDERPRHWQVAKDEAACDQLRRELPRLLAPDGGTNVSAALDTTLEFLDDPSFSERKIELVTDGVDIELNVHHYRKRLADIGATLDTVCLAEENASLHALSMHYDMLYD